MLIVQLRLYAFYRIVFYIHIKSINVLHLSMVMHLHQSFETEICWKRRVLNHQRKNTFLQFFKYVCLILSLSRFGALSDILNLRLIRRVWAPPQYNDSLSRYRDSHFKDKTVVRPSYLQHGDPYTGNAYPYWDGPLVLHFPLNSSFFNC